MHAQQRSACSCSCSLCSVQSVNGSFTECTTVTVQSTRHSFTNVYVEHCHLGLLRHEVGRLPGAKDPAPSEYINSSFMFAFILMCF